MINQKKELSKLFSSFTTVEKLKTEYKNFAKKFHPDLGGSNEMMQYLNNLYHECLSRFHGQKSFTGDKEYTYKYDKKTEQEILEKLYFALTLEGAECLLIGCWLWILGDTKKHKEKLKENGFYWHSKKNCWYAKPSNYKKRYRGNTSLSEIANKYGYTHFNNKALAQ